MGNRRAAVERHIQSVLDKFCGGKGLRCFKDAFACRAGSTPKWQRAC